MTSSSMKKCLPLTGNECDVLCLYVGSIRDPAIERHFSTAYKNGVEAIFPLAVVPLEVFFVNPVNCNSTLSLTVNFCLSLVPRKMLS